MKLATRKSIEDLQAAAAKLPQIELKTEHLFADGMYLRSVFRPADTLIVGKVHKREHFYVVASGEVTVISDDFKERIKAPRIIVSKPGTKRAVYSHVDSLCFTVHRTDNTDLDKIEAELIEEDPTAMFDAYNQIKQTIKEIT
jgi:mannose-6-phosphate isomerase-like protein (cupin superfamily)